MAGRFPKELPEAFALAAKGLNAGQIAKALGVAIWTVKHWAYRHDVDLSTERATPPLSARAIKAIELAKDGLYPAEIARQTGYTPGGVTLLLKRSGLSATKYRSLAASDRAVERAEKMASMYRQGVILEKIGQHFGVTRERVRQILADLGVTPAEGGKRRSVNQKKEARKRQLDARCLAKWGITHAERKARRQDGTLAAFTSQRNVAGGRGIPWELSFVQWLEIWTVSGKLELRGRGKGRYVMSRIKDEGGYVVGNVHIQLSTDNNRQGLAKCRSNKAPHTGVWLMYPTLSKPWMAAYGRTKLGCYATEGEAAEARAAYIEANGLTPPARGRGYYVIRGKTERYQVRVGEKYIGTFRTPDAALAARAAACQQAA
jgi:DNA-binding CsgD family transcriptional regulator